MTLYLLIWACVGATIGPVNFEEPSGCCLFVLPALLAWPLLLIGVPLQVVCAVGYALVGRAVLGIVEEVRRFNASSRRAAP
jgi:hypothetical protein